MSDRKRLVFLAITLVAVIAIALMLTDRSQALKEKTFDDQISENAQQLFKQGKEIFRFDTFGDEAFWGDTLKLHRAIQGSKFGGVGAGVSPKTALCRRPQSRYGCPSCKPRHAVERGQGQSR